MKSLFSLAFTVLLASLCMSAQEPCNNEPCNNEPCQPVPTYCTPTENCSYIDCDQQPLLDCYTNLASKYKEYGEDGRRAELANGNQEVQQLYNLKNHFQSHIPSSKLTTDQQLQLQAADACMM